MNNDSAGWTMRIAYRGFLFFPALIFTFHRYRRKFLLRGSDGDDSFMKSTPRARLPCFFFIREWEKVELLAFASLVFRRIKKSSIQDSFHFFHVTCSPHFIASHLNSDAVVGPSIFRSATSGCRKTRKRMWKDPIKWKKIYTSRCY